MDLDRSTCTAYGQVQGNQWYWCYVSPGSDLGLAESRLVGSSSLPEGTPRMGMVDQPLFIPHGVSTLLSITASDVIHSWSVPSLGIKVDAIPGRVSSISLTGLVSGVYTGY